MCDNMAAKNLLAESPKTSKWREKGSRKPEWRQEQRLLAQLGPGGGDPVDSSRDASSLLSESL